MSRGLQSFAFLLVCLFLLSGNDLLGQGRDTGSQNDVKQDLIPILLGLKAKISDIDDAYCSNGAPDEIYPDPELIPDWADTIVWGVYTVVGGTIEEVVHTNWFKPIGNGRNTGIEFYPDSVEDEYLDIVDIWFRGTFRQKGSGEIKSITDYTVVYKSATPFVFGSDDEICSSESATLILEQTESAFLYSLYRDDGSGFNLIPEFSDIQVINGGPLEFNVSQSGTYAVSAVRKNSPPECISWMNGNPVVTVYPNPVPDPQSNGPVCQNEDIQLFDGNPAVDGYVYTWYGPGLPSSGQTGHSITVSDPSVVGNAGTYDYDLTIIDTNNPSNCEATRSVSVTVNEGPVATPTISPTEVCEGATITINANASGGTAPYSYTWSTADNPSFTSVDQPSITINPTTLDDDGDVYTVVVTDANGCTSEATNAPALIVNDVPEVTITGPSEVCERYTATYTANVTGSGSYTYQWQLDGVDIPGATGSTLSYDASGLPSVGSHTISVIVVDNSSTAHCTTSASLLLEVYDTPEVSINEGDQEICEDGTVTYTATVIGSSGTYNHKWYIDGTEIPGETTTTLNLDATAISSLGVGTHTVVIEVTDPSSPLSCSETASVQLTINDVPEVTITGPSELCEGSSVTYTANVTGSGSYTYQWQLDGVDIPGATGSTLSYDASGLPSVGSHTISVIVVDNSSTAHCTTSASLLLEVYDTPEVSINEGDQEICEDGTVTYTATVIGSSGTYNHKWYIDGTEIPGETTTTLNLDATAISSLGVGTHTVVIEVTDPSSPLSCSETASVQLTINDVPEVTITGPSELCEGSSVTYTANVTGSGSYTYQWQLDGVDIPGATGSTLSYDASGLPLVGSHTISVIVVDNSSTTHCTTSASLLLEVYDTPEVSINEGDQEICEDGTVTYTATVIGSSGTYNHKWYIDGTEIPGETTTTLNLDATAISSLGVGTHTVVIEVTDPSSPLSCSETASVQLTINDVPEVTITGPSELCEGSSVTYTANVTGSGSYTYQWQLDGVDIPGATGSTLSYDASGLPSVGSHTISVIVVDNSYTAHCTSSASLLLEVYDTPVVTIDEGDQSVCEDGSVSFTANATGSGALNYKWSIDGTELIGETGSVLNLDAVALSGLSIGDHTVTVEVTDTSSPLSCSASASAQLTINEIPSLSPIPAQTVCEDAANAIFIADDLGSGYSYEWSYNGHVISGETGTSLTIENSNFPPVGDTYPVSVTVTNNLTGCFTVINTNLSVNSLPTVNLDDASTCDGQDITITATASGGSGNYVNYIWYDELGNVISSGPSNELTLTGSDVELANNGATFSVVVEDDNGCQSAPDDMTLTVNENPTVTINSGETSKDICGGAELKLEAYATGGSGTSYSYEWLLPNGTTMTGNEITIPSVLFSEHNGTYSVTVSDDATSCSATAQIEVNVIEITPVLDASATSVCENDKEITFTASGGEQYEFFRFDSQAGTWSSVQGPDTQNILVTDELNDGDRVYVEVYENGCSALSDTLDITVHGLPVINSITNNSPLCAGSSLNLSVEASGTNPLTYFWSGPNSFASGQREPSIANIAKEDEGEYVVVVTDGNGCKIDTSTTVVVNSLVIDTISNTGPVFVGEDVTLSVNVSGGIEPYEFNWEGPNGFSSKAADTTITNVSIADSGNYVVNIIDDIGCSVSDTTLVVVLEKVAVPDVRVMNSSYCEGESGADVEVINPQNGVTYEIVDGSGTSYYSVVYDGSIPVIWNVVGNAPPAGTIYRIKAYRAELVSEFELSDTFTVVEYPLPEVDTMTINGKIIPASGDSVVTHCNAGVGYKIGLNSWGPYVYRLYIDGQLQKTKTGDKDPFEFDGYYSTIGTYTIEAVGENGCASLMFGSFTIEGDDLQQFDLSAEDNGGYCEDDADGVELYLEGSENGVEYIVLQDGTPIDTITGDGNRLELGNYIQVGSDTTTYSVIAYSSVGCTYPMNDTVKVYKVPKPSAGTLMAINDNNSLLNGNEYCEGDLGVRLQLSGQEENITYRLYHDGLEVASHVGDASGDDVNFVNNANGSEWFRDAGDYYVVAETNELGCQSDPGNIVTITPVSLPEDRPILGETGFCSGDFTNLFIENTQKDVRYKLIDVIKDLIVDSIDGGNGTTINFPVADSSSYTILATNILTGCQRYFEDTVKVVEYDTPDATLNVEVDIVSVTGDACGSEKAVVSIENPEDGVTYYLWKDGNSTYSSRVTVSVSGLAEVAFPDSIMDNNGHYYIMAENSNGCEVRLQDKPDISTDGAMTVYGLVADDNLCQGDGAAIIETNGSDLGPVVYSLKYRSTGEVYDAIVGTGSKLTFSPPVSANSAFYLEARDTLTGCQVVMDSVNIRFNPLPKAFEMTGSGYYCDSEGGAEIGLSGSEFSVRYYLIEENIGLTDSVEGRYDGGEVSFNLVSTGGTYTVYAKNMDTGCTSSMKDSVKVQFMSSPQPPSVDDDTIYFCSSEAYSEIIINNAEANVTYQLTDADNNIVIEEKTESADDLVLGPVFEGSYMITASYDGSCSVPLADSVRVIEALEPLVTIPDYDAVICYGDSSSVNYDISSDPEDYFEYIVVDANDTTLIWTEEDAVEISSDYIIWKIGRAGTYYIEIRSVASGCSDQTGKIRITVNDEIDVPSISSDTIGICHSATNTSLDLAGQPGKTVFYHLYQASNSAESIDSIYAGVNTITFSNISEGEYLIRSQDIKTGCYSAFTDTIFVRPYISDELQNAYKGIFWEDLVSGIDSIEYMNNGNLTLNLDMEVLDTISKDVFNAYWVNQAENDDVRFGVSDDGEVIISKEGEDYVVSGEYADECPLFRITNRLKIREDNLSVDDIYIYLKEGEFISHQDIKVYYSNIDEGKLSYEFYIDPSLKDMMVEDEGATIKYFTGDYTIVQNNDSASLTFEKGLTFYGNNSDIQIIVKNVEIPSRIDTARVYVFAANKDVDGDKLLFIPNAFSPNGDNINDEFIIETNDKASTVSASLEVYNRWGNLVYRSNNYGDEGKWWDGRANVSNMVTIGDELPNGVYFYIYTVRIVDAEENETPITKKYQGFVELRR